MKLDVLMSRVQQLENGLRRHGVEGEDSFYFVAYQYLLHSAESVPHPERIVARGHRVCLIVKGDKRLDDLMRSILESDPSGEFLPTWYQHFVGRRFREGSGKFFTPHAIARGMASLLPIRPGAVIMDPTCGGGTFLIEAARRWSEQRCTLVANDVEASLVDLSEMVLHFGARGHDQHFLLTNIYEPGPEFEQWYGKVDFILANPPFSLDIGSINIESQLFAAGYRNSDAIFLDICHRLLKPGGRLVCLLPHSIVANMEYQRLRALAESMWKLRGVISLPEGVFNLTANTTTRADIVILDKPLDNDNDFECVFAYAPAVGIPLNRWMKDPGTNYLERIVADARVRQVLRLESRG